MPTDEQSVSTSVSSSDHPSDVLEALTQSAGPAEIDRFLDSLSPGDAANAVASLDDDAKERLLTTLSAEDAADFLERLPDAQAVGLMECLDAEDAAAIVSELPSALQADILGELHRDDAESILRALPKEEADEVRALALYGDDVAGGLMITEILTYGADRTIQDIIEDLSENSDEYRSYDIQYAYVVEADERLVGVLPMRSVLLARRKQTVRELMIGPPLAVLDTAPLDELEDFFDRHRFFGVPVTDRSGELLGVVRRAAVEERRSERAQIDLRRSQGIVSEELRSMPLLRRSSRRLGWLSVNVLLNIAAAGVIYAYKDTLERVIMLAVFLPIISDMSGCSGNQAVAVTMRELTLGIVQPSAAFRVWLKEITVGLINGIALGLLIGCVAWIWKGNPWLGLVVGSALAINTVIAVSVGGCVPLLLKRFALDPALASGPILTTITDMCGFLLALGFATSLLDRLG